MEEILSTLINGLSLGGIYAMIALGYTMVYGIAKMLNFAHGDIIMVGGYSVQNAVTGDNITWEASGYVNKTAIQYVIK